MLVFDFKYQRLTHLSIYSCNYHTHSLLSVQPSSVCGALMRADKLFIPVCACSSPKPLMFLPSPIKTAAVLNCSLQALPLVFCSGAGRVGALNGGYTLR